MRIRGLPVATVAAVLAEVVRGRGADAAVFSGLRRERVEVRAGQIMIAARVGSERAVDAFVVSVGDLAGGAIVATLDTRDLKRLAAHADRVTIASIQP